MGVEPHFNVAKPQISRPPRTVYLANTGDSGTTETVLEHLGAHYHQWMPDTSLGARGGLHPPRARRAGRQTAPLSVGRQAPSQRRIRRKEVPIPCRQAVQPALRYPEATQIRPVRPR